MTKEETIQVLQSIEDRAVDFPHMTACDWVAIAAAKRHLENSIEVKEVDLDKEMQAFALLYLEPLKISDSNIGISITMAQLYSCAKHFFELGLKAQKGEKYVK